MASPSAVAQPRCRLRLVRASQHLLHVLWCSCSGRCQKRDTRYGFFFADWLLAAGDGASLSAFGGALVQACVAVSPSLVSQWRCFVVNAVVMISHEERYTRNVAAMHVLELG